MIDRMCISLSSNCNLRCKYCHFKDKQQEGSALDRSEAIRMIDNAHEYCGHNGIAVFKVGIVGAGEPMLEKELLFAVLEHIRSRHYGEFKLYTVTNGTLLCTEDFEKFYGYRDIIDICFSLDGYEELHNYGRSEFAAVMQAIESYKRVFGEPPKINATVNSVSVRNKERLVEFFKSNGLYNVTFSKLSGYPQKDLYISHGEFTEFMQYVKSAGINSRQFCGEKKYDCTMYGNLCGVGRTNVFVAKEGFYPCGRFYKNDKYLLGGCTDSLSDVEKAMGGLVPVHDGECYYEKYEEGKK